MSDRLPEFCQARKSKVASPLCEATDAFRTLGSQIP